VAAKMMNNEIIELDSRRCVAVVNKMTGRKFIRPDVPEGDNAWYLLYENCKLHSAEWTFEYDAQLASEVQGDYKYSRAELDGKSVPALRKIGAKIGATGEGKPDLIDAILKAQG